LAFEPLARPAKGWGQTDEATPRDLDRLTKSVIGRCGRTIT